MGMYIQAKSFQAYWVSITHFLLTPNFQTIKIINRQIFHQNQYISAGFTLTMLLKQGFRSYDDIKLFENFQIKVFLISNTQVYSYDILNLTVDLGGALGLWLGLSCLSILDNILDNWISMKNYWKKQSLLLWSVQKYRYRLESIDSNFAGFLSQQFESVGIMLTDSLIWIPVDQFKIRVKSE